MGCSRGFVMAVSHAESGHNCITLLSATFSRYVPLFLLIGKPRRCHPQCRRHDPALLLKVVASIAHDNLDGATRRVG